MFDKFGRPNWDTYFMSLAFVASTRSLDPNTKHGCVITDNSHRILSIGYNGPPRGLDDTKVPLTRPEKYAFMAHAEENAILNCNLPMNGSIAYITGHPCHKCFRMLMQKGVAEIVYGPTGFQGISQDMEIAQQMLSLQKDCHILLRSFEWDIEPLLHEVIDRFIEAKKT